MNQLMETLFAAMDTDQQSEIEAQAVKAAKEAVRAAEQRLTCEEFENLYSQALNAVWPGLFAPFFVKFS